jgi:hypothetical protein
MLSMKLSGRINENGQLEVELPSGLPSGDVTIQIELNDSPKSSKTPRTGAQIVALLESMEAIAFVDDDISDPVERVDGGDGWFAQ